MKKFSIVACSLFLFVALTFGTTACHRGTGCPINENAHIQPNKKGQYKKSRTRSGLFPKDMKKKTRVN